VLVIGVDRATRLLGHLTLTEKAYDGTIRLGSTTTTDDAEGEVLSTAPTGDLDEERIRSRLEAFVGDIEQVPTAVSAIKVDGRRAYDRVRDGEDVQLAARPVSIHELEVHRVCPAGKFIEVDISVRCSSGTYIRAIARDLGAELGVGGHLGALRRTAVGPFTLEDARTLEELAEELAVLPIAEAARASFRSRDLGLAQAGDVRHGRQIDTDLDGLTALFAPDGEFLALYEPSHGTSRAVAVFV
jgi:tRNA pseudouridine55 synthase